MTFREELQQLLTEYNGDQLAEHVRDAVETFDKEQALRREIHSETENL